MRDRQANVQFRYNVCMNPATWRLIISKPLEGAWNMAVDEAILESVGAKLVAPTLRLYAWQPPCLSLGYAQPVSDVDQPALERWGWQLVRRISGGRAVLHTDELTYSVIAPLHNDRVAGSVLESYRRLAQALLKALYLLGLGARSEEKYPNPSGSQENNPVCFDVPSKYEVVTADGKKIIGSAQARRLSGVLQHGSLPLTGDLARITCALRFADEADRSAASRRLLDHATTLESFLGRPVPWDEAATAFTTAFEEALDLQLVPGRLSAPELKRASELVKEKYGSLSWTNRA